MLPFICPAACSMPRALHHPAVMLPTDGIYGPFLARFTISCKCPAIPPAPYAYSKVHVSYTNAVTGTLEDCGMPADMAKDILVNSQDHVPAASYVQCMVCFEDIISAAGSPRCTIDLLCHHCTCDTCWQVQFFTALACTAWLCLQVLIERHALPPLHL